MPRYVTRYGSTGRDLESLFLEEEAVSNEDLAYYQLAGLIKQAFLEGERVTLRDIYDEVTRGLGLSRDESDYLVRQAVKRGFLSRGLVRHD